MAVEADLVHRGHRGSNGPSQPGTLRREAHGRHDRRGEEQPRCYALPPQTSSRRDPERRRGRSGFRGYATGVVRSGARIMATTTPAEHVRVIEETPAYC